MILLKNVTKMISFIYHVVQTFIVDIYARVVDFLETEGTLFCLDVEGRGETFLDVEGRGEGAPTTFFPVTPPPGCGLGLTPEWGAGDRPGSGLGAGNFFRFAASFVSILERRRTRTKNGAIIILMLSFLYIVLNNNIILVLTISKYFYICVFVFAYVRAT